MTVKVTDEMLMALADGELTGAEAEAVREAIAADSVLQERFESFQQSRLVLSAGFDGLLERPVPVGMTKLVMGQVSSGGGVVSLKDVRAQRGWLFGSNVLSQAAAAVVLLGAAALGGYQFGQDKPSADGLVLAGLLPHESPIAAALSSTPAGSSAAFGGSEFVAVATYEMAEGQVCREFELDGDGPGIVGLACRVDTGWQIEIAAINATSGAPGQFLPASADAFELVGAALDAKGAYELVDPADEACVLGNGSCDARP